MNVAPMHGWDHVVRPMDDSDQERTRWDQSCEGAKGKPTRSALPHYIISFAKVHYLHFLPLGDHWPSYRLFELMDTHEGIIGRDHSGISAVLVVFVALRDTLPSPR